GDFTSVTISNLTLRDSQHAISDDGASLTLKSDVFHNDQAQGTSGNASGLGGALLVSGDWSVGMAVNITDCRFDDNTATGASGFSGYGEGGAIFVDAGNSAGFSLTISGTSFTFDYATGGAGGQDVLPNGQPIANDGGLGAGGAIWLDADMASQPTF